MDGLTTYLVTDACTACGACLLTCPEHAIVPSVPLQVRADRCTACGECVEVCPADALLEVPVGNQQHPGAVDFLGGVVR
ncbi:MAG TPA: 4Fe-4S binding protein [Mycobacteriales bacterium]|nr:4Fe-4S binding protein [Mycobacteriales bacterium]